MVPHRMKWSRRWHIPDFLYRVTTKCVRDGIVTNTVALMGLHLDGKTTLDMLRRAYVDVDTIDKELDKLHLQACVLRRKRNYISAIGRIPNEVLSIIFRELLERCHGPTGDILDRHWYQYTHVCFHWRLVALRDPSLWTFISSGNASWALPIIQRSRGLPLTVDMTVPYGRSSIGRVLQSVLGECRRIRTLRLSASSASILENYMDSLLRPAPILERLELQVTGRIGLCALPNDLLGRCTPALRSLSIDNCSIQWDSPLLADLTDIAINFPAYRDFEDSRPSLSILLLKLPTMSSLRSLQLHYCITPSFEGEFWESGSITAVELPSLVLLRLSDEIRTVASVLRWLRIPVTTSVGLSCVSGVATRGDVPVLCRMLEGANGGYENNPIRSLCVERGPVYTMMRVVGYSNRIIDTYDAFDADEAELALRLAWSKWGDTGPSELLLQICSMLRVDKVEVFYIVSVGSMERAQWEAVFRMLPNLRMLYVRGEALYGLTDVFKEFADEEGYATAVCHAPLLKKLVVEKARFSYIRIGDLRDGLAVRSEMKMKLDELDLKCCEGVDRMDVDELELVVTRVRWDGVNGWTSDEDDFDIDLGGQAYYVGEYYTTDDDE
jgi:hypothetical protein